MADAKWSYRIEADVLPASYEWIQDPVRQGRIRSCMVWAFAKTKKYLHLHVVLLLSIILLNGFIPVLIGMSDCPKPYSVLITVASFLAAVITAISEGLKVRELWIYYRLALEFAKVQSSRAYNRLDDYADLSDEDVERKLVSAVEDYMEHQALPKWSKITGVDAQEVDPL